ncbi:MAG: HD domain-containing phosphohydrolase, partial [Bdellovibrionota bacterium]
MTAPRNIKILLVDDDESTRLLYIFHMQNHVKNITVVEKSSANDAMTFLSSSSSSAEGDNVDLIISDYVMPGGTGGELYEYVVKTNHPAPFLLFCARDITTLATFKNFEQMKKGNTYLRKPCPPSMFLETIKSIFQTAYADKQIHIEEFEYKRTRMTRLLKGNKTKCNLYIQMGHDKFIRIVNRDDLYEQEKILGLIKKGFHYFFIHGKDYENYKDTFTELPFITVENMPEAQIARARQIFLNDILENVGVTKAVIREVEEIIEQLFTKGTKELKDLKSFFNMMNSESSFQGDHCMLLSMVSCSICYEMNWVSPEIIEKLCYAAALHDGALEPSCLEQEFAYYGRHFIEEKYDRETFEKFKQHPINMAEIISKLPQIPPDVDIVVAQHHELPNSVGFPRGLSAQSISPLGALFSLAHEFIRELYLINFDY